MSMNRHPFSVWSLGGSPGGAGETPSPGDIESRGSQELTLKIRLLRDAEFGRELALRQFHFEAQPAKRVQGYCHHAMPGARSEVVCG
jgi:hypothetical protein